jgi:hypothetical protein
MKNLKMDGRIPGKGMSIMLTRRLEMLYASCLERAIIMVVLFIGKCHLRVM